MMCFSRDPLLCRYLLIGVNLRTLQNREQQRTQPRARQSAAQDRCFKPEGD